MSRKTLTNSASSPVLNYLRTLTGLHSQRIYCLSTPAYHRLPASHLVPRRHLSSNHAHRDTTSLVQASQANVVSRRRILSVANKRQQSRNASTESNTSIPTPADAEDTTPANSEVREAELESEPKSKSAASPPPKAKNNTQWPAWRIQKEALKSKFEEGWAPRRRLSPDAMEGVRELHEKDPVKFSTPVLAQEFKVSAEAIRRILKSKWRPSERESVDRRGRWERRESRIWDHMVQVGLRPERTEDPETGVKKLNRRYPRSKPSGKGKRV